MKGVATFSAAVSGSIAPPVARIKPTRSVKRFSNHFVILVAGLVLAGCGSELVSKYFDPSADLTRDDFKQGMAAQEAAPSPPPPPIPQLQPVITAPTLGPEIQSRRVTVTVTETTPLKDVLIELAREARIGLELDPRIEGGVIFSAYDRPFDEVLRRLSDLAGLRFKLRDGVMRIELDDPFHVNYKLGYLSLVRNATSNVGTTAAVTGGIRSAGNSSSSQVRSTSEVNFWSELETNITQILTNTATRSGLVAAPPEPVAVASAPGARTEAQTAAQPDAESTANDQLSTLRALLETSSEAAVSLEAREALAEATSPAAQAAATAFAASATGAAIPSLTPAFAAASSLFSVNRQAGIVSVFGTERQHRQIEIYLRGLRKSIGAQVLIEAKILEVTLSDEFRFGINWTTLFQGRANAAALLNTATTSTVQAPPFSQLIAAPASPTTATANVVTLALGGADLNVVANAVEEFGTVRALSNPRITVMQNQTAVLKVAENDVFFEVSIEQTTQVVNNQQVTDRSVTSELKTVTVGLVMTVQPSINLDTDEITLTLGRR